MNIENLIAADQFCAYYKVEFSFINSLHEFGLIRIVSVEEVQYIPLEQVQEVEKMIRLHYDLDINLEGIEAISHLLQRLGTLQKELSGLKNRLDFYEK